MNPHLICIVLCCLILPSKTKADVIFIHSGAVDPATEGFTNSDPGTDVITGPIFNDLGTGLDAWNVDDNSLVGGSAVVYRSTTLEPSEIAQLESTGWRLSANLRMLEDPTTGVFDGIGVSFVTGTVAYSMTFDIQSDGDPTVNLLGGGSFTLESTGDQSFNHYELIYDSSAGSADLFVNGVERISDYGGASVSAPARINWGGNASHGTGRAHFNSVVFSSVPEPSALTFLGFGFIAWQHRRSRTSRSKGRCFTP